MTCTKFKHIYTLYARPKDMLARTSPACLNRALWVVCSHAAVHLVFCDHHLASTLGPQHFHMQRVGAIDLELLCADEEEAGIGPRMENRMFP